MCQIVLTRRETSATLHSSELHALGQRQLAGGVHPVGISSHVGLPAVPPRPPRGGRHTTNPPPMSPPDVPISTLAIPQSEPSRNRSASRRSVVKIADERPCGTSLLTDSVES